MYIYRIESLKNWGTGGNIGKERNMNYSLSQNGWDTLGPPCPLNVGVQDLVTKQLWEGRGEHEKGKKQRLVKVSQLFLSETVSRHGRESMRVLDSGFHAVDSGFRVLDAGFQHRGFRIPKRAGLRFLLF